MVQRIYVKFPQHNHKNPHLTAYSMLIDSIFLTRVATIQPLCHKNLWLNLFNYSCCGSLPSQRVPHYVLPKLLQQSYCNCQVLEIAVNANLLKWAGYDLLNLYKTRLYYTNHLQDYFPFIGLVNLVTLQYPRSRHLNPILLFLKFFHCGHQS